MTGEGYNQLMDELRVLKDKVAKAENPFKQELEEWKAKFEHCEYSVEAALNLSEEIKEQAKFELAMLNDDNVRLKDENAKLKAITFIPRLLGFK